MQEAIYITFDFIFFWETLNKIIGAVPLTLYIACSSMAIGLIIGLTVAIIRLKKTAVLHPLAEFYVSFTRGTPVVLHLYIVYLALPMIWDTVANHYNWAIYSKDVPLHLLVVAALSLTAGAYMSEIIRSGFLAVPEGQLEAAYSVGMTTFQAVYRVIFPQALGASIPGICNLAIGILHGSSLAYLVSLLEVNGVAMMAGSQRWSFLEPLSAAALIYWGIAVLIERAAALLEKRWKTYSGGGVA
ncbi:amino acid ABC transporter permease [Paenibacillus sp. NPDC058174]|uniref:amino acid ABC transporter permease n=1 Tax=Paenibacillus sp. NPDC058174 TaxID=3346366 RepID=UPI0036DBE8BC